MGREIKFRAWHKRYKEMYEVTCIDWEAEFVWVKYYDDDREEWFSREEHIADLELMQYTGLKDNNGVEIYEGDILTSTEYPFQDEGEYAYHGIIEYDESSAAFLVVKRVVNPIKRGISDGIAEYFEEDYNFEIIGNIYGNPELLQKEEK